MKRYLVSALMLGMLFIGVVPANATEPNGEEFALPITVPTAPNNCAFLPGDISGTDDIYTTYGDASVLVASYTIVEDADGFAVTATLQNKFYSLIDPNTNSRATSVTFLIPRCAPIEIPSTDPVIVPPVVAPPVVNQPLPILTPKPIIPSPTAPATSEPVPSAQPSEAPVAVLVQAAPAEVPVEAVVETAPINELAKTGASTVALFWGGVLLMVGAAMLMLYRKLGQSHQ